MRPDSASSSTSHHVRAALYCRVSTLEQSSEGLSLGAQEDRCRAFAHAKGWQVVQVYVDGGASGKSLDRPAMRRLLADAQQRVFDTVLFYRLDRLSRRQRDILYLLEEVFNPLGIGIQSATEPFDTTTPMGKAMLGMLAVFAQLERETIVERTKMGRAQSLKLGRWQGGKVPYGYRRTGRGQLAPDPVTAPIVRSLFEKAAHGAGPYDLANWLNTQGIAAPGGGAWWDRVLEKLLKNPVYHGYVGRTDPHPGHHEALVDEVTWATVQRKFAGRQLGPHADRPDFWIDGLLTCPACGSPIRGVYVRPTPRPATSYDDPVRRYRFYYACASKKNRRRGGPLCPSRYHHAPQIHAQVLAQLRAWHADPVAVDRALAMYYGVARPPDSDWVAQQTALDERVTRWYDAFEQGAIDAATLRQRIDRLRHQQAALEAVRPIPAPGPQSVDATTVRSFLAHLVDRWDAITPSERQELLRGLIAGGTITAEGTVTLRLRDLAQEYPLSPPHQPSVPRHDDPPSR
ncbi:recombinase family protein [Sulfobacillus harzensis]|uniref:Recombinase family protein n=1 Tax=Sulfobacillus harzensis TaxID=2729629 RepID=A0A7Y0Q360_9FIRM|nr:recombinase family protein [Sulfobacillus harzensis]NMP21859.1 recombinase family protein [Sulfobacillus harzensis]